jgi:hypothetical protein
MLHHHRLAALRAGHQQTALAFADGRDDVDDATGDVLFAADVTLEFQVFGRVQGVRFSKRILFFDASGTSPLILSTLTRAKVAFPILRRADFTLDGVAGMQVEAPDLARADVDVVGTGQIRSIGERRKPKPSDSVSSVPSPKMLSPFSGLILEQREDQFVLAQSVGAFDVVGDRHVKKLAYMECFEFG